MNHTRKLRTLLAALAALFLTGTLHAQVPALINYQGRVAVDGVNFDGAGQFKFALVNADASETFWSNDGTSVAGSEPAAAVPLTVAKGLYSVLLGDTSLGAGMTGIPTTVFSNPDVRLRVWFDDGVNASQLLSPDQRLAPAAYLADGAVSASTIADGAIVAAKIAPAAINGTHVAAGSLDFSHFTVPAAPGAGQVLGFDGNGLSWTSGGGGGGGDSVFSLNLSNDAYYNGGNVGIGTESPTAKLDIRGSLTLEAGGSPGLFTGTGNAELNRYLVLINSPTSPSASGLKTGGVLVSNDYSYANPAKSDLIVKGSVGIGTPTPTSKFTVFTPSGGVTRVGIEHTDGTVRLGTYAAPGLGGELGTVSNHPLNLFVNDGWPSVTISTAENVGIGTESPQAKLHVYNPTSVSHRIETGGLTNAWARVEFKNANGQWNVGTSRSFNSDQFYIQREGKPIAFAIETNGNAYLQGTMACKILTIRGADVAEPFDIAEQDLPKGTVVVIDATRHGGLKRSTVQYDTCVAGIVSGANGIDSGIILSQPGVNEGGQNVAISGRVYVRADATGAPIKPGDMLTTSDTPGCAMKAADRARAQGAIIGKAMSALSEGKGMVLVLVTLQ